MISNNITEAGVHLMTRVGMQADKLKALELSLAQDVARLRDEGASWRMVGVALGCSTQAAWERYRPRTPGDDTPTQATLDVELDKSGLGPSAAKH